MSLVSGSWPWVAFVLLGAYHGINPAMGWLFALAWGLQERSRLAVLKAIAPIALGHAVSVTLVLVVVGAARLVAAPEVIRPIAGVALILFGVFRFVRPRLHAQRIGMRVGLAELALWSFLMSTTHGAGLMLFPLLLALPAPSPEHRDHQNGLDLEAVPVAEGVAAVILHSVAMLAVMAAGAFVVYEWLGVGILRRAWANLDLLWALALVAAGVLTLFI